MKRLFISLLLILPVMTFAGCSEDPDSPGTEIPDNPNNPGDDDDDNDDDSDMVTPGNGKSLSHGSAVGEIPIILLMWMLRPEQALSSTKVGGEARLNGSPIYSDFRRR